MVPSLTSRPVTSGKTPYLRFDGNDYSIPHGLVRKPLTLVADEHTVRVLDGTTEVARHRRSYDRRQVIEDATHVAALAAAKRAAHELRGRDLLRSACPHAAALLDTLAARGEPLAAHTRRLLQLRGRYGAAELDTAIAEVLARGAASAAAVAHVLDQRTRARGLPPPLATVLPDDPRVRDVQLTPHALTPYDALCAPDEEDDDDDAPR